MSFTLKNIVPWGRSFDEYVEMFALTENDLGKRILGCGDGPASFNALLTKQYGHIVSVDPLYRFSVDEIRLRIQETFSDVMEQTRKNRAGFTWHKIKSLEILGQLRMRAMEEFLIDYPRGVSQGRYLGEQLPRLTFGSGTFDIALCSHLLFLYSKQLSEQFHLEATQEMCRIAEEVRIFPLLDLDANKSRHLKAVTDALTSIGYTVSIDTVPYEFQRGGNQMMRIKKRASAAASP